MIPEAPAIPMEPSTFEEILDCDPMDEDTACTRIGLLTLEEKGPDFIKGLPQGIAAGHRQKK